MSDVENITTVDEKKSDETGNKTPTDPNLTVPLIPTPPLNDSDSKEINIKFTIKKDGENGWKIDEKSVNDIQQTIADVIQSKSNGGAYESNHTGGFTQQYEADSKTGGRRKRKTQRKKNKRRSTKKRYI